MTIVTGGTGDKYPALSDHTASLTVADLKLLLGMLPDDMSVCGRDGHSGQRDDLLISVDEACDNHDRPTLEIMLG